MSQTQSTPAGGITGQGQQAWQFRDANGVTFTCSAVLVSQAPAPGSVWRNSCDYGQEWLLAQHQIIDAIFTGMRYDYSTLKAPESDTNWPEITVTVSTWADLPTAAAAITAALTRLTVPLNEKAVKDVQFPVPELTLQLAAVDDPPSNTSPVLKRWDFQTVGDSADPPTVDAILSQIQLVYASYVQQGEWHDGTVPTSVATNGPATTLLVHTSSTVLFMMNYVPARGQYYNDPRPGFCRNPSASAPAQFFPTTPPLPTDFTSNWEDWVTRLGGQYTTGTCEATWTIGGHTWHATQSASTPTNTKPTVTKDGQPLTLSIGGYSDASWMVQGYATYRFTLSDMEKMLGGNITFDYPHPDRATLTLP